MGRSGNHTRRERERSWLRQGEMTASLSRPLGNQWNESAPPRCTLTRETAHARYATLTLFAQSLLISLKRLAQRENEKNGWVFIGAKRSSLHQAARTTSDRVVSNSELWRGATELYEHGFINTDIPWDMKRLPNDMIKQLFVAAVAWELP